MTVSDLLEIFIGRLVYPIGLHDNWQGMPFLKGDANAGKSTIIELIIPKGSYGVITATQEKKFGGTRRPLSQTCYIFS
jgi:hypothetical protein